MDPRQLLIKFFSIIDRSPVGSLVRRQRKIIEKTDPERIYVENVRAFFGLPYTAAYMMCEAAVREGVFEKRIGLPCPSCQRILTSERPGEDGDATLTCDVCLLDERPRYEFARSEIAAVPFY